MSSGLIDPTTGVPPALENSPAVLPPDGTGPKARFAVFKDTSVLQEDLVNEAAHSWRLVPVGQLRLRERGLYRATAFPSPNRNSSKFRIDGTSKSPPCKEL